MNECTKKILVNCTILQMCRAQYIILFVVRAVNIFFNIAFYDFTFYKVPFDGQNYSYMYLSFFT